MPKNSLFLPVLMVLVIAFVLGVVILTGRSNAPTISADRDYPHHICTFDRYCTGNECTDQRLSIVAYITHENGEPRLEVPGMAPQATYTANEDRRVFTSTGGDLKGTLTIFRTRALDFTATQGEGNNVIEHFASGQCDRVHTP